MAFNRGFEMCGKLQVQHHETYIPAWNVQNQWKWSLVENLRAPEQSVCNNHPSQHQEMLEMFKISGKAQGWGAECV